MKISLIIPCHNEEEVIRSFYGETCSVIDGMDDCSFELLFVDDGSTDGTLGIVKDLASEDARVKYISFSRNFGKEAAMYAGFCNAKGDYVAVMDADLQDPPSLLPEMIRTLEGGDYDSVATYRKSRSGEGRLKSFFSRKFYGVINTVSDTHIMSGARDYRLMTRKMVDSIVSMCERSRFTKGIFGWVGFKTCWMPFENHERAAGKSNWSIRKLAEYSVDGIVNFSYAPLKFSFWSGLFFLAAFIGTLAYAIVNSVINWTSFFDWPFGISVILFAAFALSAQTYIHGLYLSRIMTETKKRPHFIVSETNEEDIAEK